MEPIQNPFESYTGANSLRSPRSLKLYFAILLTLAWVISSNGLSIGVILLVAPFVFFYLFMFFKFPQLGLYTMVFLGFILLGLNRYVKGIQGGMIMDGVFALSYISLFFKNYYTRVDWKPAAKDITALAAIWAAYGAFGFFNPELVSTEAYFATVRGVSFYMLLMVPLALMLLNTNKHVDAFFVLWGILSILATTKGLWQLYVRPDPWEQAWLDAGAYTNHIVFGKLRVFSFLSDAGQFGANQAYTGVVFLILASGTKNRNRKIFYIITGLLGIYGMFISGTRGAITVPFAGFLLYSIIRKKFNITISVMTFLVIAYVFFKFTSIGQNVDQIRRMRTAFDPNDKSFQLRLSNQKKMKLYLATRPFGGGIGHAGSKALKYLPYSFLANTATDSWYVMIWAEQGIVGLVLHLFILFYIIIKASYYIMVKIRDPILKIKMTALVCGMMGIMVAAYGNAVLGAFPTGMMIYISMAWLTNPLILDTPQGNDPASGSLPETVNGTLLPASSNRD
ncbi:MAG: O-antigen ligase family protein [Bacteroidetes bacterium]|nr:O-antigen ligase family protein [Bacteroidota bacterium]